MRTSPSIRDKGGDGVVCSRVALLPPSSFDDQELHLLKHSSTSHLPFALNNTIMIPCIRTAAVSSRLALRAPARQFVAGPRALSTSSILYAKDDKLK